MGERAPAVAEDDPDGDWTAPGTFRCAPGVYRIPLPLPGDGLRAVNVYALADGAGWTLVDAGWALEAARGRLESALAALGAGLGDVHRFLVTHVHRDHYTQAVAVRRDFGTRVALGRGEEPALRAMHDPGWMAGLVHRGRLGRAGATALLAELDRLPPPEHDAAQWAPPDDWIDDGATIPVGGRSLTAVATPGHTRGHVVFADDPGGLLFAGDHVLPRITPSIALEPVPSRLPLADFLDSLALVRARPDAALLPAHGPVGMRVHERVDALLAHHGARLDASLRAVRAGRGTADAVARALSWTRRETAFGDLDLFNAMLAVLETQAHLDLLVSRGALSAVGDDGITYYCP